MALGVGSYKAVESGDGTGFWSFGIGSMQEAANYDQAKAAAEAHYREQVEECLIPFSPLPEALGND